MDHEISQLQNEIRDVRRDVDYYKADKSDLDNLENRLGRLEVRMQAFMREMERRLGHLMDLIEKPDSDE